MLTKTIEINGFTFTAQKWSLPKVVQDQSKILGMLSEPMSTLAAISNGDYDEGSVAGIVVQTLMDTISSQDLQALCGVILEGVTMKNKNGVTVECTLDRMDKEGVEFDTLLLLLADIIYFNFEGFIKNGFAEQLTKRLAPKI